MIFSPCIKIEKKKILNEYNFSCDLPFPFHLRLSTRYFLFIIYQQLVIFVFVRHQIPQPKQISINVIGLPPHHTHHHHQHHLSLINDKCFGVSLHLLPLYDIEFLCAFSIICVLVDGINADAGPVPLHECSKKSKNNFL